VEYNIERLLGAMVPGVGDLTQGEVWAGYGEGPLGKVHPVVEKAIVLGLFCRGFQITGVTRRSPRTLMWT
jgi:hypothetical protein